MFRLKRTDTMVCCKKSRMKKISVNRSRTLYQCISVWFCKKSERFSYINLFCAVFRNWWTAFTLSFYKHWCCLCILRQTTFMKKIQDNCHTCSGLEFTLDLPLTVMCWLLLLHLAALLQQSNNNLQHNVSNCGEYKLSVHMITLQKVTLKEKRIWLSWIVPAPALCNLGPVLV